MGATIQLQQTLIAHRGASAYAPENTMIALAQAHALGATWVEFDVMLTRDDVLIIMHDTLLNRTTNGRGFIANKDYHELALLDAGSWFDSKFTGEKIPTLLQYITFCAKANMAMNVEIKPTKGREQHTAQAVVKLLEEHWPAELPLLVSSANFACLQTAYQLNPTLKFGYIVHYWQRGLTHTVQQLPLYSIHAYYKILSKKRIAMLKEQGLAVLAYTVNDPRIANSLFDNGVCAVFSDYPDLFTRLLA